MIKVHFEAKGYAELVAVFKDEQMYDACLSSLQELATKNHYTITESVEELSMPLTENDILDVSINIVDKLVELGYVKDCTDTDDNTEFDVQDAITETLKKNLYYENI